MHAYKAGALVLACIAWICRILAQLTAALIVVMCFAGLSVKLGLAGFIVELSASLPPLLAGYGLISTPFGGVFRFDIACLVVILCLIDYVCLRIAAQLRKRSY
ncbi:hypothetical protein KPC83_04015 [Collinsella sp. zg1085]|uniref:hypothetical protein n=1 Tax=Collinsella sp. zg1085 TaxID=2844380 RepID=UPI001C0C2674|nr:hypothetical protein [Collinsella sp. zg1085]QWT17027.1 hypothetical protein KPC83_04015 [Collinsella sp. zg1085]